MSKHFGRIQVKQKYSPIVMHTHRVSWRMKDIVMCAMVGSIIFSIVKVPFLPVSPTIILPFMLFLTCHHEWKKWRVHLLRMPILRAFLILYGLMIIGDIVISGICYASISEAGRLVSSAVAVISLTLYSMSSPERTQRATNVFGMAILISCLWFIMEITVVEPFVSMRGRIYAQIYSSKTDLNIDSLRSGLTPFNHLMGYQIVGLFPLLFVKWHGERRYSWKMLYLIGLIIIFLTLYFTSQRSSFCGMMVSLAFILFYSRIRLRLSKLMLFLFLSLGLSFIVISSVAVSKSELQPSIISKLQSGIYMDDAIFRIMLQLRALKLVFQYPFGLPMAGVDWETVGFWPVKDNFNGDTFPNVIAVHNGYLGSGLEYGLGVFLIAVYMLYRMLKLSIQLLSSKWPSHPDIGRLCTIVGATIIGLYFLQSMLHNASVLTREPVSLFFLSLALSLKLRYCYEITSKPYQNSFLKEPSAGITSIA